MLGSGSSSLVSLLSPSPTCLRSRILRNKPLINITNRYIYSTPRQQAESSTSPSADLDFLDDSPTPRSSRPSNSEPSNPDVTTDSMIDTQINDLLSSTIHPRQSSQRPYKPPTGTSATKVRDAFKESAERLSMRNRGDQSPGALARSMAFPSAIQPGAGGYNNIIRIEPMIKATRMKRTIRSRPTVGRTVEVDNGRGADLGQALRRLDVLCNANRVRADQSRQRFHERPGAKRKRLHSERYRKLFKESFKAAVGRVKEMRRKGW